MKRTLAALSAVAVVGGLLVASGPSGPAQAQWAAETIDLRLDCSSEASIRSSLAAISSSSSAPNVYDARVRQFPSNDSDSAVWVLSKREVGDIVNVYNVGSVGSGSCVVVGQVTEGQTLIDDGRTILLDGNAELAPTENTEGQQPGVNNSGFFTIQSRVSGVLVGNPVQIWVDACGLSGSGIEPDPWRVGTLADLREVGNGATLNVSILVGNPSCSLTGHYLQTGTVRDVDTYANSGAVVIAGTFTGTYDGDHYGILYTSPGGSAARWENRPPLFETLGVGGVIKRLSLGGLIKVDRGHTTREISGLVGRLDGGLISEVGSSVNIDAKGPNPIIGGLVAIAGATANTSQRIQYSSYGGRLDWTEDPNPNPDPTLPNGPSIALVGGPTIGGLVGMAEGTTSATEIRDSYSRAEISFDSSRLDGSNSDTAIYAGGLVGSDGFNGFNTSTFVRTHESSSVGILRSYFAGSFRNICAGDLAQCNLATGGSNPSHVFLGGFMGVSKDLDDAGDGLISAFSLSISGVPAVGEIVDGGDAPEQYTNAGFPEAARLSATLLRTLSTYQSEEEIDENSVGTNQPSGDSELLPAAASTLGSLGAADYLWAIEAGNVETFVASGYTDEDNYLTRTLFNPTSVERSYRREGAGVLTVHGGSDDLTVTGYPSLGRVWEICPDNYPMLVWEERDCSSGGGGDSRPSSSEQTSQAQAAGLSGAELAAFLASGLTLEQWMAQRLAATGTPQQALAQGLLAAVFLTLAGAGLVLGRRRWGLGSAR